jgi:diguanylate cyclase (GGDEF)-like protein
MIAIPFLVFFPIATAIVALSLENNRMRLLAQQTILQQKLLLQTSVDSAQTIEVYSLDRNYRYLTFNKYHSDSMFNYYGVHPSVGDDFLDYVTNDAFRNRLKHEIDLALAGHRHMTEAEIEVNRGKYFESHYNPIIDNHHEVIGVSIFAQEITQRINDEKQILHLSYHDSLTGLKNRRFYQEELERLEQSNDPRLVFVLFDINGLKIMNDAFGHHVGDLLLKTIANITAAQLPAKTEFMRIGGDEFVIIFYDATIAETERLIDKIDAQVRGETINGIHFSVSFGIEGHREGETVIDSIRRAEKKMYSKKLTEVTSSRHETIRAIMGTLHVKHKAEEAHSNRVSLICQAFGKYLNLRLEELSLLKMMANIHDIGKIAIEESILNKPGPLNENEWNEIKKHPEIGYHILLTSPEYAEIAEDILCHHERWNGTGYPRGLKGTAIPYRSRIISIADSYDAMTSQRPYRSAMSRAQALEEIRCNAGTQFDPELAQAFLKMASEPNAEI